MDQSRVLIIFAKPPLPGEVKTRLLPALTAHESAGLYRAFLLDIVAMAMSLRQTRVLIAYPPQPAVAEETLRIVLADYPKLGYLQQEGDNLGERMEQAFLSLQPQPYSPVVLIGSDSPTLPAYLIEEAYAALQHDDVVIGPSIDGGYYLVGMSALPKGLFNGVEWSTDSVFRQTMANAHARRLQVHSLGLWYDVDTLADLQYLQQQMSLMAERDLPRPAATAAWLHEYFARD